MDTQNYFFELKILFVVIHKDDQYTGINNIFAFQDKL